MRVLYLGLDPSHMGDLHEITHLPLIEIHPLEWQIQSPLSEYDLFIFTSRVAAKLFLSRYNPVDIRGLVYSIGPGTSSCLSGVNSQIIEAKEFTQNGVIEALGSVEGKHILYPRSQLARPHLRDWILSQGGALDCVDLYTTVSKEAQLPDLAPFDQIYFSSPSCVDAFFKLYDGPYLPEKFYPIGPVTAERLRDIL